jgi:hypothetical protein
LNVLAGVAGVLIVAWLTVSRYLPTDWTAATLKDWVAAAAGLIVTLVILWRRRRELFYARPATRSSSATRTGWALAGGVAALITWVIAAETFLPAEWAAAIAGAIAAFIIWKLLRRALI